MAQVYSGQYVTHAAATQAVWALNRAGLPLGNIALVSLSMQPPPEPARRPDAAPFEAQAWWEGFLEAVLCRPLAPAALREYTGAVRRGAYLMLAHGAASEVAATRQVLEASGATDIHLRVTLPDPGPAAQGPCAPRRRPGAPDRKHP